MMAICNFIIKRYRIFYNYKISKVIPELKEKELKDLYIDETIKFNELDLYYNKIRMNRESSFIIYNRIKEKYKNFLFINPII